MKLREIKRAAKDHTGQRWRPRLPSHPLHAVSFFYRLGCQYLPQKRTRLLTQIQRVRAQGACSVHAQDVLGAVLTAAHVLSHLTLVVMR